MQVHDALTAEETNLRCSLRYTDWLLRLWIFNSNTKRKVTWIASLLLQLPLSLPLINIIHHNQSSYVFRNKLMMNYIQVIDDVQCSVSMTRNINASTKSCDLGCRT